MNGYSPDCVALVKASESCRLTAYRDDVGNWTIGWGHLLPPHVDWTGLAWDQQEADSWLTRQLQAAWTAIQPLVQTPLSQGQIDALVDFTYNEGSGHLAGSSILRRLNAGDYAGAREAFALYVYAGGVKEPGLVTRRQREQALWAQPDPPQAA